MIKSEIATETSSPRNDKKNKNALTLTLSRGERELAAVLFFGVVMSFCGVGTAAEVTAVTDAAKAVKVELPSKLKEITGIVVAKTRMNLSVETSREGKTAFEMVLPIDKATKLRGYRHFDEIARGDTIKAVCKQTYEVQKDGTERIMSTVAAQIALVRSSVGGKLTSKES